MPFLGNPTPGGENISLDDALDMLNAKMAGPERVMVQCNYCYRYESSALTDETYIKKMCTDCRD